MQGFAELVAAHAARWPNLPHALITRLTRAYGTRVANVLCDASALSDLGKNFGADLTEAEIGYLVRSEWARTAEDVLWRRSKLGLRVAHDERAALDHFMQREAAKEPV